MAAPERTCVGCRTRRAQHELVRFTLEGVRVVPALPGAPGRSAYLCPGERCLAAAERRHAFARAFRGPVTLDPAVRRAAMRGAAARDDVAAAETGGPATTEHERR